VSPNRVNSELDPVPVPLAKGVYDFNIQFTHITTTPRILVLLVTYCYLMTLQQ
jgi:hypothetical protein